MKTSNERTKRAAIEAKVLAAALDLATHERRLQTIRRATKPCEELQEPDITVGFAGFKCDLDGTEPLCATCQTRRDARVGFGTGLKGRRLAKARLLRWAAKLEALHA